MSRVNRSTNVEWISFKYPEITKLFSFSHHRGSKFINRWRQRRWTKWRMSTKVLIPLMILNVTGQTGAVEALTSRVLASFFGYPTTCSVGAEVKSCTLSFSCWLRGGTRLRGCGSSWLFSCCGPPEPQRTSDGFDNTIPSSEWKYKIVPPKLRQVPQRNLVPANVFRRRADDDPSQVDCGLPATRILQKRIIGGREARFAEFPWQAHVRISEFQCGGVLDQRKYVGVLVIAGVPIKNPRWTFSVALAEDMGTRKRNFPRPRRKPHPTPNQQMLVIPGLEAMRAKSAVRSTGHVSRWFVATAAHCVSRARPRDIAVWLGALDTTAGAHTARKVGVIQKILHPLFQFRMTQPDRYDIALLKLSRPIVYTSHILPICLPDLDLELRGKSGVIAGWGKTDTSNGHTGTNLLRSATVPILSTEQCINWHQSKLISVEIHSEMICAGHSDGHQDACLGDSGGPLIVLDSGRYYLVGITSAGFGCGVDHQPGIYHNVKVTASWIRGVITPSTNYIDF